MPIYARVVSMSVALALAVAVTAGPPPPGRTVDLTAIPTVHTAGTTSPAAGRPVATRRTVERSHLVRRGDTLIAIARRYRVSTTTLTVRNRLPRNGAIRIGRRLAVPVRVPVARSARTGAATQASHNAGSLISVRVRRSAARNRAILAGRPQPSRAAVRRLISATASRHGVEPSLALAVAYNESGFQQRVVSPVDAIGVMQVLPSTGRALEGVAGRRLDLLRTRDNVTAGVLLLRQLGRGKRSQAMTLAGYYQGIGSIRRRGVLPQTRVYIRNVGALQRRFRA